MSPDLACGSPVKIVRGSYEGYEGTVERLTPQKAYVSSPDLDKQVCVLQSSLQSMRLDTLGTPQQPSSVSPTST